MRRRSAPQAWAVGSAVPEHPGLRGRASKKDVAARLGSTPHAVGRWRARSVEHRIAGPGGVPRSGGPGTVTDEKVTAVVTETLQSTPKDAMRWSTRVTAEEMGRSRSTVSQIQAPDRSRPVPAMMPGVPQRVTHDHVRAGTAALFAAPEAATGKGRVIGSGATAGTQWMSWSPAVTPLQGTTTSTCPAASPSRSSAASQAPT